MQKYSDIQIKQYTEDLKKLVASSDKYLLKINAEGRKRYPNEIPPFAYLKDFILYQTPLLADSFYTMQTRVFWLINNIFSWNDDRVQCANCHKSFKNKNVINVYTGYHKYCCVKCASSSIEVLQKTAQSSLKKFGKTHFMKTKEGVKSVKLSKKRKYGNENYNNSQKMVETKLKKNNGKYESEETIQKKRATKLQHFGDANYNNSQKMVETKRKKNNGKYESEETIQKRKNTNLKHCGFEFNFQSPENKEKSKQTCNSTYNVPFTAQSQQKKDNTEKTCLKKYGVKHHMQYPEIAKKTRVKYVFNDIGFDSSIEIAYYIWLSDHQIPFEYQPNITFEYQFNNKVHKYLPDFKVNDTIVELKGTHFFNNDGIMQCPFNHTLDLQYEAKHQCMLQNNVKIVLSDSAEMKEVLQYIDAKYGKNYIKQFKNY